MSSKPKTIEFNVGGRHFEVSRSLFEQRPDSKLWTLIVEHEEGSGAIFLERDGDIFAQMLNYLRHGSIALPINIVKQMFLRDLDDYGISYDDEKIVAFTANSSNKSTQDKVNPEGDADEITFAEVEELNRELQEEIQALTEILITGPNQHPVYASGQLKQNGKISDLGDKGKFWSEWLHHETPCPLEDLPRLEMWVGGSMRGGFSDSYCNLSWTKGGKRPLLFISSRPGNIVLSLSFGWTGEELESITNLDQFVGARDDDLLGFIAEDLSTVDRSKTCRMVCLSFPTTRNKLLSPDEAKDAGPPTNIWVRTEDAE